jgi:hypothetical protein
MSEEIKMESVIYAVVSAATKSTIQSIIGAFRSEDADKEATRVAKKSYEILKRNVSGGCARLLKILETASFTESLLRPNMIREKLYPSIMLSSQDLNKFDDEFRYRLEYLRLNGLVELVSNTEYGISRLGLAFLAEARRRRDYPGELK